MENSLNLVIMCGGFFPSQNEWITMITWCYYSNYYLVLCIYPELTDTVLESIIVLNNYSSNVDKCIISQQSCFKNLCFKALHFVAWLYNQSLDNCECISIPWQSEPKQTDMLACSTSLARQCKRSRLPLSFVMERPNWKTRGWFNLWTQKTVNCRTEVCFPLIYKGSTVIALLMFTSSFVLCDWLLTATAGLISLA